MTTRQKLAIFALSFLSIAVPVQAMPGQEENTVQKPETNLSERNARLEQQHAEAISAGLRPTLTLIDLDEECGSACCEYNDCGHYEFMDGMRKTIAEKNKIIDELEAKILVLEAKNQPWSTGKKQPF